MPDEPETPSGAPLTLSVSGSVTVVFNGDAGDDVNATLQRKRKLATEADTPSHKTLPDLLVEPLATGGTSRGTVTNESNGDTGYDGCDAGDDVNATLQRKRKLATEAKTLSYETSPDLLVEPLATGGTSRGTVTNESNGDTGYDGCDAGDDVNATLQRKRKLELETKKLSRNGGAIFAPSRTDEGFKISAGKGVKETCMIDAIENGMKLDEFPTDQIPSARMRKIAIPELGNILQASWKSCMSALAMLDLPYKLKEATARFKSGPPMLNLLRTVSGVFIVGLLVEVEGKRNDHCVVFSASKGILMDNGSKTRPVYIEEKDKRGKKAAKSAFRLLVGQKVLSGKAFSVDIISIYELCRL